MKAVLIWALALLGSAVRAQSVSPATGPECLRMTGVGEVTRLYAYVTIENNCNQSIAGAVYVLTSPHFVVPVKVESDYSVSAAYSALAPTAVSDPRVGFWRPGIQRTEMMGFSQQLDSVPTVPELRLTTAAVIFADGTALGDAKELDFLQRGWRKRLHEARKLLAEVERLEQKAKGSSYDSLQLGRYKADRMAARGGESEYKEPRGRSLGELEIDQFAAFEAIIRQAVQRGLSTQFAYGDQLKTYAEARVRLLAPLAGKIK